MRKRTSGLNVLSEEAPQRAKKREGAQTIRLSQYNGFNESTIPLGSPAEEEDHWYKVSIEPSVAMMTHLAAKAERAEKTIPEAIIDIIEIDMHRKGKGK